MYQRFKKVLSCTIICFCDEGGTNFGACQSDLL